MPAINLELADCLVGNRTMYKLCDAEINYEIWWMPETKEQHLKPSLDSYLFTSPASLFDLIAHRDKILEALVVKEWTAASEELVSDLSDFC